MFAHETQGPPRGRGEGCAPRGRAARLLAVFALALAALAGMCALAPAGARGYAWAEEQVLAEWNDIGDGDSQWSTDENTRLYIEGETGFVSILSPGSALPASTLVLTLSGGGTLTAHFGELQPATEGCAYIEDWDPARLHEITSARLVADPVIDPDPVTVTFFLGEHGSFPAGTATNADGTATLEASGGAVTPPLPSDADYVFAGWFTEGGTRFTGAAAESATVSARWVAPPDPAVQSPAYSADSVTFYYYDPLADGVSVVGDFNMRSPWDTPMDYDETTGYWWATVSRASFPYPDCLDTTGSNAYKFVDQSGNYFCDPLNPAPGDNYSEFTIPHIFAWTYDADGHWRACLYDDCEATSEPESHTLVQKSEGGQCWDECAVCGYQSARRNVVVGTGAACQGRDFTFSYTLPEGADDYADVRCDFYRADDGSCLYEYRIALVGGLAPSVADGVVSGRVPAELYPQGVGDLLLEITVFYMVDSDSHAATRTFALPAERDEDGDHACDNCGDAVHAFSGEWTYDADGHWHACLYDGCEATSAPEPHAYVEAGDGVFAWLECGICGYRKPGSTYGVVRGPEAVCQGQDLEYALTVPVAEGKLIDASAFYEFYLASDGQTLVGYGGLTYDLAPTVEGGEVSGRVPASLYPQGEGDLLLKVTVNYSVDDETSWSSSTFRVQAEHAVGELGTPATCTSPAVCGTCGEAFGEADPGAHALAHVDAKDPTYDEEGCVEHWACARCGRLFSDAEGSAELAPEDVVLERLELPARDPDAQSPVVGADGSARLTYYAPRAASVSLVGDFNGWDAALNPMSFDPATGYWSADLADLACGEHAYRFAVADGAGGRTPVIDPLNTAGTDDEGNSVLTVPHDFSAEWTCDADGHWHACLREGCDGQGDWAEHAVGGTGTPATCTAPAVCGTCGEAFGEPDAGAHALAHVPAKDPTVEEEGVVEHWACELCGRLFLDQAGTDEAAPEDVAVAKLPAEDPDAQGPTVDGNAAALALYAPTATAVSLVGDFNGWDAAENPMAYDPATGYWSAELAGLACGEHAYRFAVTGKAGTQTLVADPLNRATDGEGNSVLAVSHVFSEEWSSDADGHWHACLREGCNGQADWSEHDSDWKTEDGQYWSECLDCGYVDVAARDVPQADLERPDAVCPDQDFTCSFTLPEGAVGGAMYSVFPRTFNAIAMDVEDGVARGTIPAQWYEQGEESFELHVYAIMDDGYYALLALERIGVSHDLVHVAAREATVEEEGCVEHWACARCGALFLDAEGLDEVEPADIAIAKLPAENPDAQGPAADADGSASFQYYDPRAAAVVLMASPAGGDATAVPMTYDPATGYWSASLEDLACGDYTYQFAVTDRAGAQTLVADPLNPAADGRDYSVLTVPHSFSAEWSFDADGHWHVCTREGCTQASPAVEHALEWKTEDGRYWAVCPVCSYQTDPRDVPQVAVAGPDVVCATQDFAFSVTLPEGAADASADVAFAMHGDGIPLSAGDDGALHGTVPAQWYASDDQGFRLTVVVQMDDGYAFAATKDVAIQAEHAVGELGTPATCTDPAVCGTCGEAFGEPDASAHDLAHVAAKPATAAEEGVDEHWACTRCGRLFSDEAGENPVAPEDVVTGKLAPTIIEGAGQTVPAGEAAELTFRSDAAFADFLRVEVDGEELGADLYSAEEGSIRVTLAPAYVASLAAGEHTLGIVSQSGTASTGFTVAAQGAGEGGNAGDSGGAGGAGNGGSGGNDGSGNGSGNGAPANNGPNIVKTGDATPTSLVALLAAVGAATAAGAGAFLVRRVRAR